MVRIIKHPGQTLKDAAKQPSRPVKYGDWVSKIHQAGIEKRAADKRAAEESRKKWEKK